MNDDAPAVVTFDDEIREGCRCAACERTQGSVFGLDAPGVGRGDERLCSACRMIWYSEGITDPHELGEETLYRERIGKFPFNKQGAR